MGQFSKFCLRQQLCTFKEFCMGTRSSNIFKATNVTNLTRAFQKALIEFYRIISGNWNPLKNHEKYFLFHLNKLNILLANQILHILWIFIKPNVWYSWSLKILAIKRWFLLMVTLQDRHFVVGGSKSFKHLAEFVLRTALKILYYRVNCYFCVLVIKLI